MSMILVDEARQEQFRLAVMSVVERVPPPILPPYMSDSIKLGRFYAAEYFADFTIGELRRFFELANHPSIKRQEQ